MHGSRDSALDTGPNWFGKIFLAGLGGRFGGRGLGSNGLAIAGGIVGDFETDRNRHGTDIEPTGKRQQTDRSVAVLDGWRQLWSGCYSVFKDGDHLNQVRCGKGREMF